MTTCTTIIQQLTGRQDTGLGMLRGMVNGKNFVDCGNGFQFSFSGNRKMNKCIITLDPNDTYTVQFYKVTKTKFDCVKSLEGVYCDMLTDIFETTTGLYLSF